MRSARETPPTSKAAQLQLTLMLATSHAPPDVLPWHAARQPSTVTKSGARGWIVARVSATSTNASCCSTVSLQVLHVVHRALRMTERTRASQFPFLLLLFLPFSFSDGFSGGFSDGSSDAFSLGVLGVLKRTAAALPDWLTTCGDGRDPAGRWLVTYPHRARPSVRVTNERASGLNGPSVRAKKPRSADLHKIIHAADRIV